MNDINAYKKHTAFGGWTRIEMLLTIYQQAIDSFEATKQAMEQGDQAAYTEHFLAGQKAILAIHSGLKPDEHDVAYDVARLLHFVLQCIESQKFDDAIMVLRNMHSGFAAIEAEANQLEAAGEIAPVQDSDAFVVQA